ncbi:hypothetical protein [Streptomyces celluloflavus]
MGARAGRRESVRPALFGPEVAGSGADAERAELVACERAAVELGVVFGVGGFLPVLGALEGDAASGEQAAQGRAPDPP